MPYFTAIFAVLVCSLSQLDLSLLDFALDAKLRFGIFVSGSCSRRDLALLCEGALMFKRWLPQVGF